MFVLTDGDIDLEFCPDDEDVALIDEDTDNEDIESLDDLEDQPDKPDGGSGGVSEDGEEMYGGGEALLD